LGFEQGHRDHLGGDAAFPLVKGNVLVSGPGPPLVRALDDSALHIVHHPGVVAGVDLATAGLEGGGKIPLVVKGEDANVAHLATGIEPADVDEVVEVRLTLLEPGAGVANTDLTPELGFEQLSSAV